MTRPVSIENSMSERQWALVVEGFLSFYGWRWTHPPDNKPRAGQGGRAGKQRTGDVGYPDYSAVRVLEDRGPELAFLELKTETGRLGPGQPEWLEALEAFRLGVVDMSERIVGEWRTSDEDAEAIRLENPRLIVGVYRPSQRRELEALLAGPRGPGIYVQGHRDLLDL